MVPKVLQGQNLSSPNPSQGKALPWLDKASWRLGNVNLGFSTKLARREGQEMGTDLSARAVCLFPASVERTAPSHPIRNIPSSSAAQFTAQPWPLIKFHFILFLRSPLNSTPKSTTHPRDSFTRAHHCSAVPGHLLHPSAPGRSLTLPLTQKPSTISDFPLTAVEHTTTHSEVFCLTH